MLSKFSVRKPFTVLVAVVICLVLGFLSFQNMSTDFLPNMEFPYALVMTTYPGASPEEVEKAVSEPVEQAMERINNVKELQSISIQNMSMVVMSFNDGTDMGSTVVDMRESLDMVTSQFDDSIGNPTIMKMNPDMMPIMVAALDYDKLDSAEVTKKADDIHNGIRDLHFDAICYIPESAISTAANGTVVVSSELYDAYTGMWLTAGSTFNNSSRGDNYYLHTVSWRGNSYLIEFTYSTDWNFQVGDWGAVLTKSYSVYMPADYDGLVFAAQAEPDTYEKSARKMQLDSISPEACVLDLDTLEPYSSLYFSLCD